MLRQIDQNIKSQNQIDSFIEIEYQKYKESQKGPLIGSGSKKVQKMLKEKTPTNAQTSESLSFGRFKELTKVQEEHQKLIKMLGCQNFEQALEKVDRVNKWDKFLEQTKHMVKKVTSEENPTIINCWKVVREAMTAYSSRKYQEN